MTFSCTLAHDFCQLKTLFTAQQELAEIEQEFELQRPSDYLYYNRWQVVWIITTAPIAYISYLFLKAVSFVLWSYQLDLLAKRMIRPIEYLLTQWQFGYALWVPCENELRYDLTDVYSLSSIKREKIGDPFIRAKLHRRLNKVNFNRIGKGVCWGSTHWFNYLLLKKWKSRPIEELVVAVAKQFEDGQPRQAALIQSFYGLETDLVDLTSTPVSNREKEGVYLLSSSDHCVSYVRAEEKEFVFDPRIGLIYLSNSENLPKIFEEDEQISASLHSLRETR
ncbi:MAG: hypothetical protein JSS30_02575 [Verrucomicrobia bacterium]|nr:hypothetical protein [Verrucomicrobiota bacterium]